MRTRGAGPSRNARAALAVLLALGAAVLAVGASAPAAVSAIPTPSGRTSNAWPYGRYSIWNMPLGGAATFVDFDMSTTAFEAQWMGAGNACATQTMGVNAGTDGNCWQWVSVPANMGVDTNHVAFASAADPVRTVQPAPGGSWNGTSSRCAEQGNSAGPGGVRPWQVRVPASFSVADATSGFYPNNSAAIVQPGGSVYQFNYACSTSGSGRLNGTWTSRDWANWLGSAPSQAVWDADQLIGGEGKFGGHGGSALSAHGGNIRKGELLGADPIRHALEIDLPTAPYLSCQAGDGYRWPALVRDAAGCWKGQPSGDIYGAYRGSANAMPAALRMGALIAIKAGFDCKASLSTAHVRKICEAMQSYGAYVVDTTGWNSIDLNVDAGVTDELRTATGEGIDSGRPGKDWYNSPATWADLAVMYDKAPWAVVDDNGPDSIGGRGVRANCLAPPFSDATPDTTTAGGGTYPEPAGCPAVAIAPPTTVGANRINAVQPTARNAARRSTPKRAATKQAPTKQAAPKQAAPKQAPSRPVSDTCRLAGGAPVRATASSEVFPAANTVDGGIVHPSRWISASTDAQWLQLDLGAVRRLKSLRVIWDGSAAMSHLVQSSDDPAFASGAVTQAEVTGFRPNGPACRSYPLRGTGRYVRITMSNRVPEARAGGWGYSVLEAAIIIG